MSDDQIRTRPEYTLEDYMNATGSVGPLAYQWEDKPHRLVFDLCGEIRALEAENTRLREALGFYAHRGNYVSRIGMDSGITDDNFGDRARAALGDDA